MGKMSGELERLKEEGIVKEVKPLPVHDPLYVIGDVYWCDYWQSYFMVCDVFYQIHRDEQGTIRHKIKSVTVIWADGDIAIHNRELNPSEDYRLILAGKV